VIADHSSAELGDVVFEVYQVLALLVRYDIVEVDVFVAPFEIMNNSFVCQLFFDNENVLEEIIDALIDVEVVELGDHGLLVFQVALIRIDQCITFVDHAS